MYKYFVAMRYLLHNWMSALGILAVFVAIAATTIVLSVMKGFDQEFRHRLRATLSDISIEKAGANNFADYEAIMQKIQALPHVQACSPRFEGFAVVRVSKQQAIKRVATFVGVDLDREIETSDFAAYWRAWRGGEAREELAAHLSGFEPTQGEAQSKWIQDRLKSMRHEDFQDLSRKDRTTLQAWANRVGANIEDLLSAGESAKPAWSSAWATGSGSTCPVFAGDELTVLGVDSTGARVHSRVGDNMILYSTSDVRPENSIVRTCTVAGKMKSGIYEYDQASMLIPLREAQNMMSSPGSVTSISVRLDSYDNAPEVRCRLLGILTAEEMRSGLAAIIPALGDANQEEFAELKQKIAEYESTTATALSEGASDFAMIGGRLTQTFVHMVDAAKSATANGRPNARQADALKSFDALLTQRQEQALGTQFQVRTWEDQRRTFLRAIWLERRIMALIMLAFLFVSGFLIFAILHTTVTTKTKDIGILKAIGGSTGGILALFLTNGLLISLIGCVLGTGVALVVTEHINAIEGFLARTFGFSFFPKDVYYFDRVPVDTDPLTSAILFCAVALVISLAASAYPAAKAARLNPVEALRYE